MQVFQGDSIFWIETNKIKPNPYQPRFEFDEARLRDLAESIRQYGILQPLVVTRIEEPHSDGISVYYELIAGERRLRAARIAGLSQVPAIIRTNTESSQTKLELAIIENLQREDLNPIDRARAFDRLSAEFGFKHTEIAEKVGRSREYVSNTMRLLTLPDDIQKALVEGKISEGHTRALLMLSDRPEEQITLLKDILYKKLNVRETEEVARRFAYRKRQPRPINPEIKRLEEEMSETLGTRVHIETGEKGGKVVIDFFSFDDLKQLVLRLDEEHKNVPQYTAPSLSNEISRHEFVSNEESRTTFETPIQAADTAIESRDTVAFHQNEESVQDDHDLTEKLIKEMEGHTLDYLSEQEVPAQAPVSVVEEQKEEPNKEDDMYSIRNFSL